MGETTIRLLSVRSRKVIGENSALDITDFPFVTDYWNSRNGFVAVLPQAACPGLFQRHHAPVFFGIPMRDSAHQAVAANHGAGQRNLEGRSEEHTSELQSLMRISYTVFCLKKNKTQNI